MILIGAAVANNNGKVTIATPGGLNTVKALRLTNYLTKPLLLTNINDGYQSQEILPPLTSMVFKNPCMDNAAFITGVAIGAVAAAAAAAIAAGITVEWATDAPNDFLGTYPALVGTPA